MKLRFGWIKKLLMQVVTYLHSTQGRSLIRCFIEFSLKNVSSTVLLPCDYNTDIPGGPENRVDYCISPTISRIPFTFNNDMRVYARSIAQGWPIWKLLAVVLPTFPVFQPRHRRLNGPRWKIRGLLAKIDSDRYLVISIH